MGRYAFILVIILIVTLLGGVISWGYSGYQSYHRAHQTIEALADGGEREAAWEEFGGYGKHMYGGILIGTLSNNIWVWGRAGLRHYKSDTQTVYSAFDGCSPEILSRLKSGEAGAVAREVTTHLAEWRGRVQAGDYVRAYPTQAEQLTDATGTHGTLREIYGYNFWLFMHSGMEERCQAR
jgi:hypothetical protein